MYAQLLVYMYINVAGQCKHTHIRCARSCYCITLTAVHHVLPTILLSSFNGSSGVGCHHRRLPVLFFHSHDLDLTEQAYNDCH